MLKRHFAVMLVAGCSGSDPVESPDAVVDPPDAPSVTTRTVTGTVVDRHVTLNGEVAAPADLSSVAIAAVVPPAFDLIQGIGTTAGTFTIPNVPEGTYYLQFGVSQFVTDRSSIDLSSDVLGRANAVAVTNPSPITFNVGNVQAWQTGDELQMFVPGSGTNRIPSEFNAT